jgi:hypothetical protein
VVHDSFSTQLFAANHECLGNFARFLVRAGNNCRIYNCWMGEQHGFKLSRRHLKAFVLNQLFGAVNYEEVSLLVRVSHVAGMQPTVSVNGVGSRFRTI